MRSQVLGNSTTHFNVSQVNITRKYARAVKQKVCNEAEKRERDWGDTLNTIDALGVLGSRASRA